MNVDQENATAFKEFAGDCPLPLRVFFAYLYATWSLGAKEAFEAGGSRNPKIRDAARQKLKVLCTSNPAITSYAPESFSYGYDEAGRVLWFPRSAPLRGIDRLLLRPERALYAEHLRPFFNRHEKEKTFDLRKLDQIDRDNLAAIAGEELEQISNLGRVLFGGKQGGSFSVIQVSHLPDIDPAGVIDRLVSEPGTFVDLELPSTSWFLEPADLPKERRGFEALALDAVHAWQEHATDTFERVVLIAPVFLEQQQEPAEALAAMLHELPPIDTDGLAVVVMNAPTPTVRAAVDASRAAHGISSAMNVLAVGGEDLQRLAIAFPWVWSRHFGKTGSLQVVHADDDLTIADLFLRSVTEDEARAIEQEFSPAVEELCCAFRSDLAAGVLSPSAGCLAKRASNFAATYERVASAVFDRVRSIGRVDKFLVGFPDSAVAVIDRLNASVDTYYSPPAPTRETLSLTDKVSRELRRLIAKAALPVSGDVAPFCVDDASFEIYTRWRHLAVFGGAGCGKTTTLWYLVLKMRGDVLIALGCGNRTAETKICEEHELRMALALLDELAARGHAITVAVERLELESGRAATDTTLAALLNGAAHVNSRYGRDAVRVLTAVEVPATVAFKNTYRPLLRMMGFVSMETVDGYFVANFVEYAASALEIYIGEEARYALHHAPARDDDPTPSGDFSSATRRGHVGLGDIARGLRLSERDQIVAAEILRFFDETPDAAISRQRKIEEI